MSLSAIKKRNFGEKNKNGSVRHCIPLLFPLMRGIHFSTADCLFFDVQYLVCDKISCCQIFQFMISFLYAECRENCYVY